MQKQNTYNESNTIGIFLKLFKKVGRFLRLNKVNRIRTYFDKLLRYEPFWRFKMQGSIFYHVPLRMRISGVHEKETTEFVRKIIKPGWNVLDLGVDFGYYTLLFSKLVGNSGQVIAYEPSKNNIKDVKKAIKVNKTSNVVLHEKAVTDFNGEKDFYVFDGGSGIDTLFPDKANVIKKNYQTVNVTCVDLDSQLNLQDFPKKIDLIKIDVEGAELNVLKGAQKFLLAHNKTPLILELSPRNLEAIGVNVNTLLNKLNDFHFETHVITEGGYLSRMETSKLMKYANSKGHVNLFCIPKNMMSVYEAYII